MKTIGVGWAVLMAAGTAWAGTGAVPVAVSVAAVEFTGEAIPVEAPGILARKDEVTLAFPTEGIVAEVLVRAGDTVRKGQALARLDVEAIDARAARAKAAADQAKRDAERAQTLFASQTIGRDEYEALQTAQEVADADLRTALFLQRYATIDAPGDGRILRRLAEPNQTVAAGQPILAFAADDAGWLVRVGLAERDLVRVAPGDTATITASAAPDKPFEAVITQIAAGSDTRTRTTEVELTPRAVPPGLRSGFVVHASIRPAADGRQPRVPASALIEGRDRSASVFVVDPASGLARRAIVTVVALHGTYAYLGPGLAEGDRVVVRGAEFVRDGSPLRIHEDAAP